MSFNSSKPDPHRLQCTKSTIWGSGWAMFPNINPPNIFVYEYTWAFNCEPHPLSPELTFILKQTRRALYESSGLAHTHNRQGHNEPIQQKKTQFPGCCCLWREKSLYKVLFSKSKSVVRKMVTIKVLAISQSLHEIKQLFPGGMFPSALSISRTARVKMSLTACKSRVRMSSSRAKNSQNSWLHDERSDVHEGQPFLFVMVKYIGITFGLMCNWALIGTVMDQGHVTSICHFHCD